MAGSDDGGELDERIYALRARLAAADPGSAAAAELAGELTDLLADRCQRRLAGIDADGARDDLDELAGLLESALDATPAELVPDAHAALAQVYGARAGTREPGPALDADLDSAVSHARLGLAALASAPPAAPRLAGDEAARRAVATELRLALGLGLAQLDAAGQARPGLHADDGPADARAGRDEAIAALSAVIDDIPQAEPAWLTAAEALGCAVHDRYGDPRPGGAPPDAADLDVAIDLLTATVAAEPGPWPALRLVFALADRLDLRYDPADVAALLAWGQWLLDHAPLDPDDESLLHDTMGAAHRFRADNSPQSRDADTTAAIAHLKAALAAAPAGDPGRGRALASVADAYWQHLDGDAADWEQVDAMTGYADQAWALLPAGDEDRAMIGLYLATGTHERLRRPGVAFDEPAASRAIAVLAEIEPLVADNPELHLLTVCELGHFLVARGQATGSAADLAAGVPWLLRAAAGVPANEAGWSDVVQTLCSGLSVLASLGMDPDHLDLAIDFLVAAAGRPDADSSRAAMTRGTLGAMLVLRASFTASGTDLDDGIAHLLGSFDVAPSGDAYRAGVAANLASALLTRYFDGGQVEDIDAARFYLGIVGSLPAGQLASVKTTFADVDMIVAGARGMLGAIEGLRGDAAAFDDAVAGYAAALAALPTGHPQEIRIRGDLGMALALRALSGGGTPRDFEQATRYLADAAARLPAGHIMQPVALLRTGGILAAAAMAADDPHLLRAAMDYLASALGRLDPRFGDRFRFTAMIGAAELALHRHGRDPGDLAAAIGWLEQARADLDRRPSHPLRALCLANLAQAYQAQGDQARAREAGFAAVRARARDLLLQSGTARSLKYAKAAASEAMQVAGWCLEQGDIEAAVEALELGRGLVLHAATSIAGVPDLLAAANREDLAERWRLAAAAPTTPAPWDSGRPGTAFLPDLLSGATGAHVPDDLRARALAALADSPEERRLLAAPSLADLAGALARTGADALVYLLSPAAGAPARAVLVPASTLAGARACALALDSVPAGADHPVQAYVAACSAVLAPAGRTCAAHAPVGQARAGHDADGRLEAWRRELESVCDWAWPAVVRPVLEATARWGLARPPRLVLVPAGSWCLVPWHAARWQGAAGRPARYAVQESVISYAASGRQLIQVAGRPALPLGARPVVVGDPTRSLPGALAEAQAILLGCYPSGRYLGSDWQGWREPPSQELSADGSGTPAEVLRQLPDAEGAGASMLHLGCHGVVAGSAPGESCLVLAGRQELKVDAVLRQARNRPPGTAGGLVSLAACGSDLAASEYDEALTPATAFLAAGAATVLGARWLLDDLATALPMFMAHHLMASQGHQPRDALRLAQLWMLDPGRVPPPGMPPELATRARRPGIEHDVTAWAGIVHQGR